MAEESILRFRGERRFYAMQMILRTVLSFLFSAVLLIGSGASADQGTALISEGVKVPVQIQYVSYEGEFRDLFLSEGDRIAVISPSSLPSRSQVDATVEGLRSWGYVPVEGRHVCDEVRTLEECLEDLCWALEDPTIKAIFCVRGGFAASQVVEQLPPGLIEYARKLIIGYSDITVYHSAWTTAGLPSIHASMSSAFTDLPEENVRVEQQILRGEIPVYTCDNGPHRQTGEAEGLLIGGNLSVLTTVLNTAYDCTAEQVPYILVLEDEREDLQHILLYLTILKHFGVLEKAAGIICGEWVDIPPMDEEEFNGSCRGGIYDSVADMIVREFTHELDIPVAFGFPVGHGALNYPLLMGQKIRLRVTEDQFTIEWIMEES